MWSPILIRRPSAPSLAPTSGYVPRIIVAANSFRLLILHPCIREFACSWIFRTVSSRNGWPMKMRPQKLSHYQAVSLGSAITSHLEELRLPKQEPPYWRVHTGSHQTDQRYP